MKQPVTFSPISITQFADILREARVHDLPEVKAIDDLIGGLEDYIRAHREKCFMLPVEGCDKSVKYSNGVLRFEGSCEYNEKDEGATYIWDGNKFTFIACNEQGLLFIKHTVINATGRV